MFTTVVSLLVFLPFIVTKKTCTNVLSYNAGLTPHIPNFSARKDATPAAILASNADVVCLQEYWMEEDLKELFDEVDSVYPNHFTSIHEDDNQLSRDRYWYHVFAEAPCSGSDTFYISATAVCAYRAGCISDTDDLASTLACASQNCRRYLRRMNADCVSCLTIQGTSASAAVTSCFRVYGDDNNLNPSGLAILSKREINSVEYKSYFPRQKMTLQRGVLEADIEGIGKVVCTHMSSDQDHYFEYDMDHGDYVKQHLEEVAKLNVMYGDKPHILLGDLNCGSARNSSDPEKNVAGEMEDNYDTLLKNGYTSPYVTNVGDCTYCLSNELVTSDNVLIDHIMLHEADDSYTTSNEKRSVDQEDLSDHYGVQMDICVDDDDDKK